LSPHQRSFGVGHIVFWDWVEEGGTVGREREDEREAEYHKSGVQWMRTWQGKMMRESFE
jgi:hypothetical protein